MYRFIWIITWPFMRLFYPVKIVGKENLKKVNKKGAILASNHLSNVDPALIASYNLRRVKFIAKKELFKNCIARCFFKSIGIIPVDRESPSVSTIKQSIKILKNGELLSLFPEGKRNKQDDGLKDIKNGCCLLAIKAKAPIVPIIIQKKSKIFRKNIITIGEPFELSEFYDIKPTKEILENAGKKVFDNLKMLYL